MTEQSFVDEVRSIRTPSDLSDRVQRYSLESIYILWTARRDSFWEEYTREMSNE